MKKKLILSCCAAWLGASVCFGPMSSLRAESPQKTKTMSPVLPLDAKTEKPTEKQVDDARRTAKMLDEIYKSIIVLVTDKYVKSDDDFAAGSAAVLLFRQMSEGDSHRVRLIDATGDPYEPANVASDDFEKAGLEKLKKGSAEVEELAQLDGKPVLRVMTAVPVVHERCVMCHDHYKDVKPGAPIGAMSYVIPIR